MPIVELYTCEICGVAVSDADLVADGTGTLRRIEVGGHLVKPVVGTPVTVALRNFQTMVFCGLPHLRTWFNNQT